MCLAMPAHRDLPVETAASLMKTQSACIARGIPFDFMCPSGSSLVVAARSKAAHWFLKSDKNRIFWIDSDMVWEPDAFLRLLALSTVMDCVMAAYPSKRDPINFMLNAPNEVETNEYGCLPNIGTGLGFTCIQRHVMERLAERAPKLKFVDPDVAEPIPHIFRTDEHEGHFRGEDIAFFADIKDLGFTPYLDPSIRLGHHGSKTFFGTLSEHLEQANGTPD